jgi:hypothetical protein
MRGKTKMELVAQKRELTRPLRVLVPMIQAEIKAGDEAGIEHYRAAGEMLNEAKEQVAHGEWQEWIKRNFKLSAITARRYMAFARLQNGRSRPFSNITQAIEPNRSSRIVPPSWHEPVRESINTVNVERLKQERQSKEREEKLISEIAAKIIDIGYRALAAKFHPDRGGNHDAMARLNKARALLKGVL